MAPVRKGTTYFSASPCLLMVKRAQPAWRHLAEYKGLLNTTSFLTSRHSTALRRRTIDGLTETDVRSFVRKLSGQALLEIVPGLLVVNNGQIEIRQPCQV